MTAVIDWTGTSDFSDRMIKGAGLGLFARGATGRVCLVMVAHHEDKEMEGVKVSTMEEIEEWAESVPGGYLDF